MSRDQRKAVSTLKSLASLWQRRDADDAGLLAPTVPLSRTVSHTASKLAAALDRGDEAVVMLDAQYRVFHASPATERWWTVAPALLHGHALEDLVVEEDRHAVARMLALIRMAPAIMRSVEARLERPQQDKPWIEFKTVGLFDLPGMNFAVVEIVDAGPQREALERVDREHEILRAVFDAVPMSLYVKDLDGHYISSNRANLDRFGFASEADLIGKTAFDIAPTEAAEASAQTDRQVIDSGEILFVPPATNVTGIGDPRWYESIKVPLRDAGGKVNGVLGITRDVTESKEAERRLAELASQDALTGLPNRRSLIDRLTHSIEQARNDKQELAVIFVDLDFFKAINDIHGHEFGDHLLRSLAQGLSARLRPNDWVARFGGDEFVLVCYPVAGEIEGYRIASEVLNAVRAPLQLNGVSLRVDASIGIAFLRNDHRKASDLIRNADAAMYLAKEQGRNRVAMFDDSLHRQTLERSSIDQAMRLAIERNEFTLMYQPKVSLADGKLVGFEALLRWHSQEHGMMSPANFIPLAEETGLILAIGRWALQAACTQLRQWQQRFPAHDDLILAVNVSMRQLFQDAFLDIAREIVDRSGIYPNALELEITETTAMSNPQRTMEILAELKRLGLRIALDDFGTGYSSLSHLQRLPIDVIKIDRAFVHDVSNKRESGEIVRLVVAMSRALGITSVAEGVETREDMVTLKALGADIAQGYLFSRPLGVAEAEDLLRMSANFLVR